nr:MAG TPA: hypothetical protein [Caudoviricetes sp.]
MPKIAFLFLPDFTTWGKTAFYFLRNFWGLSRPRLPPHIPRPRPQPPENAQACRPPRAPLGYTTMGILYKYPHKLLSIF